MRETVDRPVTIIHNCQMSAKYEYTPSSLQRTVRRRIPFLVFASAI